MRTFRIALAQTNPTVGDLDGNTARILRYMDKARAAGADLVAFPELAITGYPPEDLLFKAQFIEENRKRLDRIVRHAKGIAAVVGFVDANSDIYNAAAVISNGKLVDVYHKMFLPNYGVFDEDRYFRAGRECPVYVIDGVHVGVNICEDIWYAVGPTAVQREGGAEVIITINGSPYHAGMRGFRERMVGTRASDNQLIIAYVNMVGGQDELVFDGGSMVFDQKGEVIARARQFQEDMLVLDLDVEGVLRERLHAPRPRKEHLPEHGIGELKRIVVSAKPSSRARPPLPTRAVQPLDDMAEVYQALVVGARDYVRKNGFKRVVIGLSGGIDSSLTCCVAVDALGKRNVVGVGMPSRYSSEGSLADARALADALGVRFMVIPIEQAFTAYLETLSEPFSGTQPNVAEENIQARIRGNILMALSNKFGWLVLSTGNKSELSIGYSTLYGDMAGGFSVLKDVPKTLAYKLAAWRNAHPSREGRGPIPKSVLAKPPSPELRADQKTEEERVPYRIMDPILKAYVEEDRTFEDIVGMGNDAETVQRVLRWVDKNEYKRRQAPPGVKITPRAFGRDRRMPITNGYQKA